MAKAIPFLLVKNGIKAITLYKDIFGAKLVNHQPFSKETGQQFGFPDNFNYEDSTMFAELEIYGATIYLSDHIMGQEFRSSGNVEVTLDLDTKDQVESIYEKAKKHGSIIKMELQQTFWGRYFARFEDPEGIGWQLNLNKEE